MTTCDPADWSVRPANDFCRNDACAREALSRALAGVRCRWSESAGRWSKSVDGATTLRPHDENPQVSGSPVVSQSAGALRAEWAQLAADWGIGGYVNAADELLKRNPAAAPTCAIEAGWRLLDLLEWAGIDSRHPLASETWRAEP